VHPSDFVLSEHNYFRIHALRHSELLPDDFVIETTVITAESVLSGPQNF
jgi:hypothetical protein